MEYRIAHVNDIDAIISLWQEARIYHEELDPRLMMLPDAATQVQDYYHEQISSEDAAFYLAFEKQVPVGYICAQLQKRAPVYKYSQVGFIDGLFVKEEFRRIGVGKKLVELALSWFQEREIDRIQLNVASLNQPGIDFWKKCGFTDMMHRMNMQI